MNLEPNVSLSAPEASGAENSDSESSGVAAEEAEAEAGLGERLRLMPWFLLFSLGASAFCTLALYGPSQRGDYQNKYQDYRALAEGLRVQLFWHLSGLNDSVADHYLSKQRGELEWIRQALRVWEPGQSQSAADASKSDVARKSDATIESGDALEPDAATAGGRDMARLFWVEEQRKYFARKARSEHEALEHDEKRIARVLKLSALGALVLMLILVLPILLPWAPLEALKHQVENPWIHGLIMISIVLLAVAAGLLHSYNAQRARAEHAKQFARMNTLFENAGQRLEILERRAGHGAIRDLMRELGREVLNENGDWVLLHRERPLEVPHAG